MRSRLGLQLIIRLLLPINFCNYLNQSIGCLKCYTMRKCRLENSDQHFLRPKNAQRGLTNYRSGWQIIQQLISDSLLQPYPRAPPYLFKRKECNSPPEPALSQRTRKETARAWLICFVPLPATGTSYSNTKRTQRLETALWFESCLKAKEQGKAAWESKQGLI